MAGAAIFTALSYRATFFLLAIFLIGSMSVILIAMVLNPSVWPAWGLVTLPSLLALSTAFTVWVVLHPEDNSETTGD